MTEKELQQLQDDARRYRALRANRWCFAVQVRYIPDSYEERRAREVGANWLHSNNVAGSLLDELIDAWMQHPTYAVPRR